MKTMIDGMLEWSKSRHGVCRASQVVKRWLPSLSSSRARDRCNDEQRVTSQVVHTRLPREKIISHDVILTCERTHILLDWTKCKHLDWAALLKVVQPTDLWKALFLGVHDAATDIAVIHAADSTNRKDVKLDSAGTFLSEYRVLIKPTRITFQSSRNSVKPH
ncbi:hypothetical protein K443DRAFT_165476 [Laccaria amethystina LaAM-08-1]|uniref:Uncharacterized protein n=1 Tax=Laccaria amethystina LaAM-08-1 TaxID=1095629 RepID=A0A0C9YHT4_9AGAR|nr:hypothetical protein K443DRAFT_165476 [Laccaria amethystina LaAM-08-1]